MDINSNENNSAAMSNHQRGDGTREYIDSSDMISNARFEEAGSG